MCTNWWEMPSSREESMKMTEKLSSVFGAEMRLIIKNATKEKNIAALILLYQKTI